MHVYPLMPISATRLVFPGPEEVCLEPFDCPAPAEGQVRVQTSSTLLSTGTETIVFGRKFDPGTHWDQWVKYPFHPGYAAIGNIDATGPGVTTRKIGDRVVWRGHHQSHDVVAADQCWPVPDGLDDGAAIWFALAKIAAMGAAAARLRLGESVLVIGAGPVGQMAVRWMAASGPRRLLVADPVALRLELALQGGATDAIEQPIEAAREAVLAAGESELPDLVIDTTGNAAVFQQALGLARTFGRVVLLGDTGSPDAQHLTADVVTRGVRIVGAHDLHESPEWDTPRIVALCFRLARAGRFPLDGLNTHTFAPDRCVEAYTLACTRRAETMGILFRWN